MLARILSSVRGAIPDMMDLCEPVDFGVVGAPIAAQLTL